jgi:hypothetical protein
MSFLTHRTYFPQASKELVLLPLLGAQLEHNPRSGKFQPLDAKDTFFHKEQPCQIGQTHLESYATLSFMEKCKRKTLKNQSLIEACHGTTNLNPY